MSDFIDVGNGNLVNVQRLIAIVAAESSPVRRIMQDARDRSALIDASAGKKTRSALIMDSDHVVTSALETALLQARLAGNGTAEGASTDGEEDDDV